MSLNATEQAIRAEQEADARRNAEWLLKSAALVGTITGQSAPAAGISYVTSAIHRLEDDDAAPRRQPSCKTCGQPTKFAGVVACTQCVDDGQLSEGMRQAGQLVAAEDQADAAISKARGFTSR